MADKSNQPAKQAKPAESPNQLKVPGVYNGPDKPQINAKCQDLQRTYKNIAAEAISMGEESELIPWENFLRSKGVPEGGCPGAF